jgi:hypothetical protein
MFDDIQSVLPQVAGGAEKLRNGFEQCGAKQHAAKLH